MQEIRTNLTQNDVKLYQMEMQSRFELEKMNYQTELI
jgi:hypothetical protein